MSAPLAQGQLWLWLQCCCFGKLFRDLNYAAFLTIFLYFIFLPYNATEVLEKKGKNYLVFVSKAGEIILV